MATNQTHSAPAHQAPVPTISPPAAPPSEAIQLSRLHWYNDEITRYRDLQYKFVAFFSALPTAVIYLLLDTQKALVLREHRGFIAATIVLNLAIGLWQFRYIVIRLYDYRRRRAGLRHLLGIAEPEDRRFPAKEHRLEGLSSLFPWSLVLLVAGLALLALWLLWR